MWLGQQAAVNYTKSKAGAHSGDVTIGGDKAAVMLESEKRQIPLALPGGYFWKAREEQEALVLRSGDGLRHVVGLLGEEEKVQPDIQPGEVAIVSQGGTIYLLEDMIKIKTEACTIEIVEDSVSIQGKLYLNGIDVEAAISGQ